MSPLALPTPEATERLGQLLARHLPDRPAVMYLDGDLGAGKTTTARALLHALGVTGAVRSPTYTLIERYDTACGEVAHLDLYRIADPEELEYLALDELADRARLWLVEWARRGEGALPAPDLVLRLSVEGAGRRAELDATSPEGRRWAETVHHAMTVSEGNQDGPDPG
ncbi:tRNA (adenosine(37)-N6)-threonylcarbamoyltransferase complex ATPase subunit type 1 TsaE [Xanthomonadaceae bacterium JHOS43]|nr:tRNA (adenosine(37)-N6)-threonylcarbamoyltransferase complex ATPase subunit type 1 TsaE [Xanthomonadaceae bacterium JHOS43]